MHHLHLYTPTHSTSLVCIFIDFSSLIQCQFFNSNRSLLLPPLQRISDSIRRSVLRQHPQPEDGRPANRWPTTAVAAMFTGTPVKCHYTMTLKEHRSPIDFCCYRLKRKSQTPLSNNFLHAFVLLRHKGRKSRRKSSYSGLLIQGLMALNAVPLVLPVC